MHSNEICSKGGQSVKMNKIFICLFYHADGCIVIHDQAWVSSSFFTIFAWFTGISGPWIYLQDNTHMLYLVVYVKG